MKSVSIIGVGRVGGALALGLSAGGYRIKTLVARDKKGLNRIIRGIVPKPKLLPPEQLSQAKDEIILISTQDSEIVNVVEHLPTASTKKQQFVFHTSGSRSSETLRVLSERGYQIGSIHPLVSISDPELGVLRFKDSYFCVEGDAAAVAAATEIVSSLGGKPFSIKTKHKTLYHASAVTACGHFVALVDVAIAMLSKCGLDSVRSKEILLPLIESTLENLKKQSVPEALTGTFARGDIETLTRHLSSLESSVPDEQIKIYLELGKHSLKLARELGIDSNRLALMYQEILNAENEITARKKRELSR